MGPDFVGNRPKPVSPARGGRKLGVCLTCWPRRNKSGERPYGGTFRDKHESHRVQYDIGLKTPDSGEEVVVPVGISPVL